MKIKRHAIWGTAGRWCRSDEVEALELSRAEILSTLKMMQKNHACKCEHPQCRKCVNDRICDNVIAKAEGRNNNLRNHLA